MKKSLLAFAAFACAVAFGTSAMAANHAFSPGVEAKQVLVKAQSEPVDTPASIGVAVDPAYLRTVTHQHVAGERMPAGEIATLVVRVAPVKSQGIHADREAVGRWVGRA